jgi:NAD(P)-dependent dehydrogenase (short-subunit alcohol dehydrogenase family)
MRGKVAVTHFPQLTEEERMREFNGKVAVVTGGASGIGRAMAQRFAAEGMKVVVADVETRVLAQTEAEMKTAGATIVAVPTDVSSASDVQALADRTIDAFGAVHILCNNAGVPPVVGPSWKLTEADWQWVLGVNLWGVIHGIRAFVPIMLKQGSEGHIVNTASIAGLLSAPWAATYDVAKHGVVTLSESLHGELAMTGSKVKVSVLCPAWVKTQLMDGDRNRPAALQDESRPESAIPQASVMEQAFRQFVATGTEPAGIAEMVLDAIREQRFYILPHPQWKEQIRARMEDILEDRNPGDEVAA